MSDIMMYNDTHVTSVPLLAIFRQRLKTFLFHLSYPDLVIWFVYMLSFMVLILLLGCQAQQCC